MTKTPRLRATASGMVHIVDPEGFVLHTVTIEVARAMKQRKEIEPAARPGYAKLIPQPIRELTPQEKRALQLKRERQQAERARRRTKR